MIRIKYLTEHGYETTMNIQKILDISVVKKEIAAVEEQPAPEKPEQREWYLEYKINGRWYLSACPPLPTREAALKRIRFRDGKGMSDSLTYRIKDDIEPVVKPKTKWFLEGRKKGTKEWTKSKFFLDSYNTRKEARKYAKEAMVFRPSYEYRPYKKVVD